MRIFLIVLLLFTSKIIAQDYKWGRQFGDGQTESIKAIVIDDDGNSYMLGESTSYYFDLDPGIGEVIVENNTHPLHGNICFLTKLDSDGNYVWGKVFNMNRSNYDHVIDLKIGSDNNLYAGMILSKEYFGDTIIPTPGNMIVKLDLDGNELMAKSIKNNNSLMYNSLYIDNFDLDDENNIYLTGWFTDNVTIDPTNSEFNLIADGWGNFVLKMNSDGTLLWKTIYDFQGTNFNGIQIGPRGDIYVFMEIYNSGVPNISLLKNLNAASGNLNWEKSFTYFVPHAFHISQNGNLVISAIKGDVSYPPTDVDPSPNTVFTTAYNFLVWYSQDGDFMELKEYFTTSLSLRLNVIESDEDNNYYFAGPFSGTIDADPSANTFFLSGYRSQLGESLAVKFNSNFDFESAFRLGQADVAPTPYDNIYGLRFFDIAAKDGNVYYAGSFAGYGDLDPSTNVDGFDAIHDNRTLTNDGFIMKIGPCNLLPPIGNSDQYFCILDNATIQNLTPDSSSIKWYDSLTNGNELLNTTPLVDGTVYYASRTIPTCSGTPLRLAVTAHISPSPTDPVIANQIFCESEGAMLSNLNVSGLNLKWYSNLTSSNLLSSNTLLTNGTIYYVSQSIGTCESNRIPITASVTTTELPIVSQNPFLCQNVSHILNEHVKLSDISITGQNIKWYDALTGGNILPLTTRLENGTTYYASQTISGCESARIAVSPTVQETTSPIGFAVQYFCDTETLTVQDLVVTGTDVIFYDDRYAGTILPFSTPLVDGVIYWASQTINGCKSYVRLPVLIDILNGIPANDYQTLICDELNDGQENVALSSYNSNLIANINLYSFEYYTTFEGANMGNASDKINDFDTFRLTSGENTVYVKIGMNALCFKIVALKLTVISSPVLAMRDLFSLCKNNNVTIYADPGYRYLWSNSATTPSITVSTPGNYWVTVFKDHGSVVCSTTKHFQVVISNRATIDNINVQDWTANDNTISVFVSGDGDYEYSLDGVNYQTSNQFNELASGEYRVYVNDKNGCGLTWKDLFLLMHPKFFTPNNDGANDFWKIKFSSLEPGLSVKIFDRYGKFIKELFHNDAGWDGTYNGQQLPATDYWFVVKRANGTEHRGHFSLKR